jgi:hypothetical protein
LSSSISLIFQSRFHFLQLLFAADGVFGVFVGLNVDESVDVVLLHELGALPRLDATEAWR